MLSTLQMSATFTIAFAQLTQSLMRDEGLHCMFSSIGSLLTSLITSVGVGCERAHVIQHVASHRSLFEGQEKGTP